MQQCFVVLVTMLISHFAVALETEVRVLPVMRSGHSRTVHVPKGCEVVDYLNEGSYGVVFSMKCPSGKEFAVKKIDMMKHTLSYEAMMSTAREALLLSTLKSRYVLSGLLYTSDDPSVRRKEHYLVMPKFSDDLFEYLQNFDEKKAKPSAYHPRGSLEPIPAPIRKSMAYQILKGIDVLHSHGLMHLDIKPENILVNTNMQPPYCVIADLGSVDQDFQVGRRHGPEHLIVTRFYRPPEILLEGFYTKSADVWSVGCTLMELITRRTIMNMTGDASASTLKTLEAILKLGFPEELTPQMESLLLELDEVLHDGFNLDETHLRSWMQRLELNREVSLTKLKFRDPTYFLHFAQSSHQFWHQEENSESLVKKTAHFGRSIAKAWKRIFHPHKLSVPMDTPPAKPKDIHQYRKQKLAKFIDDCGCYSEGFSDEIDLLEGCFCLNPDERPDIHHILEELERHPEVQKEQEDLNLSRDLELKFVLDRLNKVGSSLLEAARHSSLPGTQTYRQCVDILYEKVIEPQVEKVAPELEKWLYEPCNH
ncbi:MAG: protein kinase [Oligoflexales bacterium]